MSASAARVELISYSSSELGRGVTGVCDEQKQLTVSAALVMLDRALVALNAADAASLPTAVQAQALRALERAEAKHTAARAQILAAFMAQDGYEDDGQGGRRGCG